MLVMLLLLLLQDKTVLVLTNGKRISCSKYKVEADRVIIWRGDEKMSLPESLFDWTGTEAERKRIAAGETVKPKPKAKPAKKKSRPTVDRAGPPKRKPIVLTDDTFAGSARKTVPGKPVTIQYRKDGNSIVVNASINGQGPFYFILDTGAEVTVVSPAVLSRVRAEPTGRSMNLVGVGNRVQTSPVMILDEVSLKGAVVRNLEVVSKNIGIINSQGIVGLLGQDYLNHFVTETDPRLQRITLKPNKRLRLDRNEPKKQTLDPEETRTRLGRHIVTLKQLADRFEAKGSPDENAAGKLRKLTEDLPVVRGDAERMKALMMRRKKEGNMEPNQEETADRFLACYSRMIRLIDALQSYGHDLSAAFSGSGSSTPDWKTVADPQERWTRCLNQQ
ncbi:MAG: retropepsin-like aspartic protease [Acidobacteriota bacterium]|nr:retropepsin-like aspartic protease [Acidobacteriota bacterium]